MSSRISDLAPMGTGQASPIERRRHARVEPGPDGATDVLWPAVFDIELLDISLGGVAFSSSEDLTVGHRVQVRTVLAGAPFSATAQVVRTEPGTQMHRTKRYLVACTFPNLDDAGRKTLGRFLGALR